MSIVKPVKGPSGKKRPGKNLLKGLTRELAVERLVDVCFGFQLIKYRYGQDAKRLGKDLLRLPNQTLRAIFILGLVADRSASHRFFKFVVSPEVVKSLLRNFESERKSVNPKQLCTTGPALNNHGEARQAIETAQAMQRATQRRPPRFASDPAAQ